MTGIKLWKEGQRTETWECQVCFYEGVGFAKNNNNNSNEREESEADAQVSSE